MAKAAGREYVSHADRRASNLAATEKKCLACCEVKPIDAFYINRKETGSREPRCKKCSNSIASERAAERQGRQYKTATQRQSEAANRNPWEKASTKQLEMLGRRTQRAMLYGWELKAATVMSGLRNRDVTTSEKIAIQRKDLTWKKAASIRFRELKARTDRWSADAWQRKAASVARNQRRRAELSRNA